eukprot:2958298-Prymnesium_polylepis.2
MVRAGAGAVPNLTLPVCVRCVLHGGCRLDSTGGRAHGAECTFTGCLAQSTPVLLLSGEPQ